MIVLIHNAFITTYSLQKVKTLPMFQQFPLMILAIS